jgi:hypothetical protein
MLDHKFMESQIVDDEVVIVMHHAEVCKVIDGQPIVDRGNPFDSSAKIEVRPIYEIDPEYKPVDGFMSYEYFQRLNTIRPIAHYLMNQDIILFVQPEILKHGGIAAEHIAREAIQTMFDPEDRDAYMQAFPPKGIQLRFDGYMPKSPNPE